MQGTDGGGKDVNAAFGAIVGERLASRKTALAAYYEEMETKKSPVSALLTAAAPPTAVRGA